MGAFQGVNYKNYQIPRFAKLTGATAGFGFNHATEAFNFGLRKTGILKKKTVGPKDAPKRTIANQIQTTFEADLLQTGISDINNLYKLIKSGPHQLLMQTAKGTYLAFTDNDTGAGTFTTPIAS